MDITYTAPPTCKKFMRSDADFRVICGPLGSGKTTCGVVEVGRRCIEMPPGPDGFRRSRWAIVRNTMPQLKDTTFRDFIKWWPPGEAGTWRESEKIFYLEFADVKAEILFRALDTPEDVRRVLSLQLTGAFLDECREIHPEIVDALAGRVGRFPAVDNEGDFDYWSGMIGSTNPPEMESWWYKAMEGIPIIEGDPNTVVNCEAFRQPSGLSEFAENRNHLKPDYYERLASGRPKGWVDTYVHGEYSASLTGVPVYAQDFQHGRHVSKQPLFIDGNLPVIVGVDFGRTPAAVFKQVQPDGRIFTIRECVAFDMGLDRFMAEHIRPTIKNCFPMNPMVFIVDPSGGNKNQNNDGSCYKDMKAEFRADGYIVKKAVNNDPDARIQATEKALNHFPKGDPLCVFDPSCKWLIDALRSKYRYAKVKDPSTKHKLKPDKNDWSHVAEANQYADRFILGGKYISSDYMHANSYRGFNPLGSFVDTRRRPALPQGY